MLDADATKPDDWDEDAPRQIEDDDAEKPDGWLDDEPAEVDDPGILQISDFWHPALQLKMKNCRPLHAS